MSAVVWLDEERVDAYPGTEPGAVGFLVRTRRDGGERYSLQQNAARTNRSNCPKLDDWCGETNNVSVYADGLARVAEIRRNGRVRLERLARGSDEERRALEELGYPELAEEV